MEIIKRKSGERYREMIWINGKQLKSPMFKRKTDCRQWLAEQRAKKSETQLYGDNHRLRQKMSFQEFSRNWLEGKKANQLALSTLLNYERYLKVHLLPHLGEKDLKTIIKSDIEKIQIGLAKDHNAKGVNLIMTVLRSILLEALKEGFLLKNPAIGIKKLTEMSVIEAYWTKAEIDQFLRANSTHPLYSFFLLALNTGLRKGELAALKWDRVDFSRNQITVSRTRDAEGLKETTKTKLKRVIPMNPLVRATLLNLFKSGQGAEFVFITKDGSPIEVHHIYRDFSKAQTKAGILNKIRFHDLRHTFASQFMMNDGNVFDLQKLLGHTDIKMTMRYAHYSPEHLQNAMKGFELGYLSDEPTHILPTALIRPSRIGSEQEVFDEISC